MSPRLSSPWLIILSLLFLLSLAVASPPPISVKLQTSWQSPQLPLEILETAAVEDASIYWPLLERLSDAEFRTFPTEKEYYERVSSVLRDDFLQDPVTLGSFDLGLSLHIAGPKIEAYYQFYETSVVPSLPNYDGSCDNWVLLGGQQICSPDKLGELLSGKGTSKTKVLPFDHVYNPSSEGEAVVLYADIQTEGFEVFHRELKKLADAGQVQYILRYRPSVSSIDQDKPLFVSGYGVELMLKRTDYIVIDDRDVEAEHSEKPEEPKTADPNTKPPSDDEEEETAVITPLHSSDLKHMGYQAVQLITTSSSPLTTLQHLSQDFPSQSSKIASIPLNETLLDALRENTQIIPGGENLFWMNGMHIPPHKVEAFNLLSVMRRERGLIASLRKLGLSNGEAVRFLSHEIIAEKIEMGTTNRFDVRDEPEGGNVIIWLNDLELDSRYASWPTDIRNIMRPLYPGQLHQVRKNIHHVVFALDFSKKEDLTRLLEEIVILIKRQVPIRFGIVGISQENDPTAAAILQTFYHLVDSYGRAPAMQFIENLLEQHDESSLTGKAKTLYTGIYNKFPVLLGGKNLAWDEVIAGQEVLENVRAWTKRLGVNVKDGAIFGNGQVFIKDDTWIQKMGQSLNSDVQILQRAVYGAEIGDDDDILEFLFQDSPKTRNEYIFPVQTGNVRFLNLVETVPEDGVVYLAGQKDAVGNTSVIWVVDDFDSLHGSELVRQVVAFQAETPGATLGLVHNPGPTTGPPTLSLLLYYLSSNGLLDGDTGHEVFDQLLRELEITKGDTSGIEKISGVKAESWRSVDSVLADKFWERGRAFAQSAGFSGGERGVVINGRVVGPIKDGDVFGKVDFEALSKHEGTERIHPAVNAAIDLGILSRHKEDISLVAAKLTSIASVSSTSDVPPGIFDTPIYSRRRSYELLDPTVGVLEYGSQDDAVFQFAITLDPLSEAAQKWSSIIKVLSEMSGVYIRVYLNPRVTTTELPIARFYRYVLTSSIEFENDGSVKDPAALYTTIPEDPLLTMGFEVPPAWVVVSKECIHDLDNIVLSKLSPTARETGINAIYELKNILIDGHARDISQNNPRGIQIILGTEHRPHVVDTIVMANLGYLQLKANPGVWTLDLKEGRSREIFEIQSVGSEGWSSRDVAAIGSDIVLTSFEGATIYPRLVRREGKDMEDVLESEESGSGFFNQAVGKLNKFMGGSKDVAVKGAAQAEVNIFSVASGHLYERFIYIMIQSVLKHTKSTVKFWFIENFLSPSFKKFIPLLANELGFDYELVTYKWPYWLRGQREKQRTIWGYKILFLDVLFPLDLDKVIFVDADQIVRTDLKTLVDLDLHGAPYGYTPMCDSRAEVEGFRFWKQGFWKDWLKGKPYHISALYVIDLKRFRQLAAGDRLRSTYQALSADKNSLANLDQDLPNYAQHVIPIYSLPQEWLWCETWCSIDALTTAKTIDLCNDPLTKTPKLTRAKNIAEWTTYDRQVAELAQRLLRNGGGKDGGNGTVVDESMFVQIDSSSQKDTVTKPEEVDTPEAADKAEGRERDEL